MKSLMFVVFAVTLILQACTENKSVENISPAFTDSTLGFVIADTIIYDINIVNRNADDLWSTQRLQSLNRKVMLDNVYNMVYTGQATAYNHTTGERLTIKQVEELEETKGFTREDVDMIQFKETWFMNPDNKSITKKVISMVLGSQVYSNDGQYLANRAVMRVEFGTD